MGGAHGKPLWILPEEAPSAGGYSDGVVTYEGFRVLGSGDRVFGVLGIF